MTIPAIGALSAALPAFTPITPTSPETTASSATGGDFAAMLSKGLESVQAAQDKASGLAVQAATGDLTDIHDYSIAATEAGLVTELASAIRTKGIDAFNQIMGMQA